MTAKKPPKTNKFDFVREVDLRGFEYTTEKENEGEWNEATLHFVNGKEVASTKKGERPDWLQMIRALGLL